MNQGPCTNGVFATCVRGIDNFDCDSRHPKLPKKPHRNPRQRGFSRANRRVMFIWRFSERIRNALIADGHESLQNLWSNCSWKKKKGEVRLRPYLRMRNFGPSASCQTNVWMGKAALGIHHMYYSRNMYNKIIEREGLERKIFLRGQEGDFCSKNAPRRVFKFLPPFVLSSSCLTGVQGCQIICFTTTRNLRT